eukprot:gene10046-23662_t
MLFRNRDGRFCGLQGSGFQWDDRLGYIKPGELGSALSVEVTAFLPKLNDQMDFRVVLREAGLRVVGGDKGIDPETGELTITADD